MVLEQQLGRNPATAFLRSLGTKVFLGVRRVGTWRGAYGKDSTRGTAFMVLLALLAASLFFLLLPQGLLPSILSFLTPIFF